MATDKQFIKVKLNKWGCVPKEEYKSLQSQINESTHIKENF